MISEIAKVVSIIVSVLGAVGTLHGLNLSSIGPILAKVAALLSLLTGLQSPTTVDAAIADLADALSALKATGILPDSAPLDDVLAIIAKYDTVAADYTDGQVAIIDANFSYNGIPGAIIALSKSGAASQLLGGV